MKQAKQLFTTEQKKSVEQAVADAELKTSCEIVPVVASSSGRYDRAEDIIGFWLVVLVAITVWMFMPNQAEPGAWDGNSIGSGIAMLVVGMLCGLVGGILLGHQVDWLRQLFTPRSQMQDEVASRARQVFFDQRVHHTAGSTGLLIYISLFEHMAIVLADQALLDKLGQPFLEQIRDQVVAQMKADHPVDALVNAIQLAGDELKEPFPRDHENDVNELQDTLIFLDAM